MIQPSSNPRTIALAGNPNTGKTTLFNALTGARAKVGNYPGITVDRHEGRMRVGEQELVVLDVPGAYSLSARSAEEQLALAAITGLPPHERPDAVVLVVDASQLARNLYLVLQVLELGVPAVVALTMVDLVEREGQRVDVGALQSELGVPVVSVHAGRGRGLEELRATIARVLDDPARATPGPRWVPDDPVLEADVAAVAKSVPTDWHRGDELRERAFALWSLLSVDSDDELEGIPPALRERVASRRHLAEAAGRDLDEELVRGRYTWIEAREGAFLPENRAASRGLTDRIDRVLLNPVVGFALFLALMTLVFQSLFRWADPLIGLIEGGVGAVQGAVASVLPASLLSELLVEGVIAGVGGVVVFLPQILLLFLFIGLMEDTGYMARVAFLMDRVMKSLGLHGRAFVPMLSGFACAIPAIMAARTMERRRDRLLLMMVVPLMTCSARLPVYGLLIAAIYPPDQEGSLTQGLLMAGMYLFSTLVALAAAAVLSRTVLRGPRVPLILEMPPYRMPHWPSVLRMMLQKSSVFVREAGTIILLCSIGMWALLSFPREPELDTDFEAARATATSAFAGEQLEAELALLDDAESAERLQKSFGGRLGHVLEPAIEPLGFDWKIGIGLIGAFAAREVFVSTMAVVYGLDEDHDEASVPLREKLRGERRADGRRLYTPLVCLSLMIFFALACQCMSTVAVTKRETGGWGWPAFQFGYMTVLAWVASFAVYQGGRLLGFE